MTHEFSVTYKFSKKDIENIFDASVNWANQYWLAAYEPTWISHRPWSILKLNKPGGDEEYDYKAKLELITLNDLCNAAERAANDPQTTNPHGHGRPNYFDFDNYDGPSSDEILQIAVFGFIAYG